MYRDKQQKENYLQKNMVSEKGITEEDCFKWDENGKIILESLKCKQSCIDITDYAACIGWISLPDSKMALLKNTFGDVYRTLGIDDYYIAKYNPIVLPEVSRQFQNEAAQYYFVTRATNKKASKIDLILTTDFKNIEKEEELIEGGYIVAEQMEISKMLMHIRRYLEEENASPEDIENIRKDFIKQSIFNKFIEQTDENNRNWGVIKDKDNRFKMSPIYDLDCACNISKKRTKKRICKNRTNKFGKFNNAI